MDRLTGARMPDDQLERAAMPPSEPADEARPPRALLAPAKVPPAETATATTPADTADAAAAEAATPEPASTMQAEAAQTAVTMPNGKPADDMAAPATPELDGILLAAAEAPGYRLQLGSFRSIDRANRLIRTLSDDHADLLNQTQLAVREASIDGQQQVFRVVSNVLPDRAAANSLCDALKGRDLGCLMLRNR